MRLAFSPTGQRLVVSPLNQVFVLEAETGEMIHAGSLHFAGVNRAIKLQKAAAYTRWSASDQEDQRLWTLPSN